MTPLESGTWLLRGVALGVRFALELGSLAAFGALGSRLGGSVPSRVLVALGLPLMIAVVWGLTIAPRAPVPWSQQTRNVLGCAVFIGAALTLREIGYERLGVAFAAVAVADTAVLLAGRW